MSSTPYASLMSDAQVAMLAALAEDGGGTAVVNGWNVRSLSPPLPPPATGFVVIARGEGRVRTEEGDVVTFRAPCCIPASLSLAPAPAASHLLAFFLREADGRSRTMVADDGRVVEFRSSRVRTLSPPPPSAALRPGCAEDAVRLFGYPRRFPPPRPQGAREMPPDIERAVQALVLRGVDDEEVGRGRRMSAFPLLATGREG